MITSDEEKSNSNFVNFMDQGEIYNKDLESSAVLSYLSEQGKLFRSVDLDSFFSIMINNPNLTFKR